MNIELREMLASAGYRLTTPRVKVFEVLKRTDTPMSIAHIAQACPSVDRVSIYRTMTLFGTLHIVAVVNHSWKQLYELASPFRPHHHHLVCSTCGALTEIHSKKLESIVQELTREHDFEPSGHHFEITGSCRDCSRADNANEL